MSNVYDNWERLVGAVLKREQLWQLFHAHSRSPSISSVSSSLGSSLSLSSPLHDDVPFDFASVTGSHMFQQRQELGSGKKGQAKLVFFAGSSPFLKFDDLLRAPTRFLGKGTFGKAYVVEMSNQKNVVVKRLTQVSIPEREFRKHMELVGEIKHENVSPLRAYYFFKDEKIVMYDYYDGGSVSAMLNDIKKNHLDWEARLQIAVGAARGISYIHEQGRGKIVHGNIKSSNIFLNSKRYGCVSEVGLVKVMSQIQVEQSVGYHPREVTNAKKVSQSSDVYSFGVLLLELLTGKSPILSRVHLVTWIRQIAPENWMAEVFDKRILKDLDSKEEMVEMLKIALNCLEETPKQRPKMSDIVKIISDVHNRRRWAHKHRSKQPDLVRVVDNLSERGWDGDPLYFHPSGLLNFVRDDDWKDSMYI